MNVSFLPGALDDYVEARMWYAEQSRRAAAAFEAAVDVGVKKIAADPERFPSCDDCHRFHILKRFPFSLVFRVSSNGVLIVAVAHSSREQSYWKSRG